MPVVALRVTAHNGLTVKQRKALRVSAEFVDLGEPAEYETTNPHDWLVFADARFDLESAALLAVAFKNPNFLPDPTGLSRAQTRANIKSALTWEVPAIPEGEDPYEYTANHNANNPAFGMWSSLPEDFTPKAGPE